MGMEQLERGFGALRNEVGVIEEAKGKEERRFRRGTHTKFYFCPFCRTPLEGYFGSIAALIMTSLIHCRASTTVQPTT
jgi:hypothetical protein